MQTSDNTALLGPLEVHLLPILKKKDVGGIAGTIIKNREPDEKQPLDAEQSPYDIKECAKDILKAIQLNDSDMLADALRDAIKLADQESQEDSSIEMKED